MEVSPNGPGIETISHYRILKKIGSGGMGDFYEAEDLKLGRRVALKFLPQALAGDQQALERFQREARSASALNHANICTIYEIADSEERPFIAMELLDGETLRTRLWAGPLGLNTLLDLAIQIAGALDAAHSQGIIHRDIKPENLFVTKSGSAKVVDFGVAKFVTERRRLNERVAISAQPTVTMGQQLTGSGIVVGTTSYMSPEQVRGEELDSRSDLFAFGAVMYEMATGKRAFPGNTIGVICEAILNREPEPAIELNRQVPQRLEEIIEKALEKDVTVRYQSAADIRADLIRLKRTIDSNARLDSGRVSAPADASRRLKARASAGHTGWSRAWPLALVAIALLAIVGGVYYFRAPRSAETAPAAQLSRTLKQTRLTANSVENPVDGEALSPDGRYLAYSDRSGIHVKALATGESNTVAPPPGLSTTPNAWFPIAWFPQGSKFLANAISGTQGSTWVISMLGGAPQLLRQGATAQAISSDGSQIVFFADMDFIGGRELWIMGPQGDNPRKLLSAPDGFGFLAAGFSPDGKFLWYGVQDTANSLQLRTLNLQTQSTQTIANDPRLQGAYWLPNGRLIYSLARNFNTQDSDIWQVAIDEKGSAVGAAKQITNWPGFGLTRFTASADGSKLAFLRTSFESDVYVSDYDHKKARLSNVRRLTLDEHNDMPTAWTRDGKSVIFFSDRDEPMNIYRQDIDKDSAMALTSDRRFNWGPRLNPDGTAVHYLSSPTTPYFSVYGPVSLMKVSLSGGPPQLILTGYSTNDHRCARAPAQICVFDELSDDRKHRTLYTYDEQQGRGKALVTYDADPYSNWDLSPDGTLIAFSRFDAHEGRIHFLSLKGKSIPELVVRGWSAIDSLDWTTDGKNLLLSSSNGRGSTLLLVDLKGNARPLWHQSGGSQTWGIPSPDGRHMALASGSNDSNVWVIEDF